MNKLLFFFLVVLVLIVSSCSTTKNIPENKYLLNSIKVTHDTRNATSDLEDFSRQQPNSKLRLMVYNMAGSDSTKWLTRQIRKLGQKPVIYNAKQAELSAQQIQKEMINQGYLNATVDTMLRSKGVKMNVTYNVKAGTPYKIRNYTYQVHDSTMAKIIGFAVDKYFVEKNIKTGDYYDMTLLEAEKDRVNSVMRNVGYADFSREQVYFRADSTLGTHQVDLFLDIYPPRDSSLYKRYRMNDVTVIAGFNTTDMPDQDSERRKRFFRRADTVDYKGVKIVRGRNKFLRNSSIARNNYMHKGDYYSDYMLTHTYEAYTKMGAINQVNITTTPVKSDSLNLLDATIILVPANAHWFRASLDGTNSAGDIGVAPSVSYQHQNLFNGSELLGIRLKGAYEFIASNDNAFGDNFYEYGADVSLKFPLFVFPFLKKSWRERPSASTDFSVGINNQKRPEYKRQFFNFTAKYSWSTRRNLFWHNLDFMDINYVSMPWASDKFKESYLTGTGANALLRETYKDQLIARTAYNGTLTRGKRLNLINTTTTFRFGAEIAGILPRLATLGSSNKGNDGHKRILGVAYAEYVKASFDFAQTFRLSKRHSIAYHVGMGIAQPYGNSDILPFERRFFGGGANGIRGWNTRGLGPGAFKPIKGEDNFVRQAGDLELEMSIENRYKVTSMIELAAFVDAGNIWTLKKYEGQEGGRFKFNEFYKEIAIAYGAGLRLDLEFLLLRLDLGVRAYDPSRDVGDRFVAPAFKRMAWHFGIGYPF